jgi:hypothetical protein
MKWPVSALCAFQFSPFWNPIMFVSFFPRPLVFAVSAALWGAFAIGFWYTFGSQINELLGRM